MCKKKQHTVSSIAVLTYSYNVTLLSRFLAAITLLHLFLMFMHLCLVRSVRPSHHSSFNEASARTLVVLDVYAWKHKFYVNNTR